MHSNGQGVNNIDPGYWSGLKKKEVSPGNLERQSSPTAPKNSSPEGAVPKEQRVERYLDYKSIASALGIPEIGNVTYVPLADYPDSSRRRCDGCYGRVKISGLAILGLCGHVACSDCLQKSDRADKCTVSWCSASAAPNTIHVATNLARGNPKALTREGSKLDAIIELIQGNEHGRRIGKDRQVLIFVQNEHIGHSVQDALTRAGITYYSGLEKQRGPGTRMVKNSKVNAVNSFKGEDRYKQSNRKFGKINEQWRKCLVLNMFDESAAGV